MAGAHRAARSSEDMFTFSLRLPAHLYTALRLRAHERHISINSALVQATQEWLQWAPPPAHKGEGQSRQGLEEALADRMRALCAQFSQMYESYCADGAPRQSTQALLDGLDAVHTRALAVAALSNFTLCPPALGQSLAASAEALERARLMIEEEYGEEEP